VSRVENTLLFLATLHISHVLRSSSWATGFSVLIETTDVQYEKHCANHVAPFVTPYTSRTSVHKEPAVRPE
jgi:hypothetical protein